MASPRSILGPRYRTTSPTATPGSPDWITLTHNNCREASYDLIRLPRRCRAPSTVPANAIDAMGDGGSITLRTRRDGGAVRVEIIDDSPSIPAEVRDQVFDWLLTTRGVGEGAGLGLPTARQIVKAHDGTSRSSRAPG